MPSEIAVIATSMPMQSNRPPERHQTDPDWRESQRQQRRAEFWQSLMADNRR